MVKGDKYKFCPVFLTIEDFGVSQVHVGAEFTLVVLSWKYYILKGSSVDLERKDCGWTIVLFDHL